jgi:hypothetical protein
LVSKFPSLAILIGKKMKKKCKFRKNVKKTKTLPKFGIKNWKEKMSLLMCKNLKVILIIPTLSK